MFQVETVGDVPRLVEVRLRLVDLDGVPLGEFPQHVRLVSAATGEGFALSCNYQDFHVFRPRPPVADPRLPTCLNFGCRRIREYSFNFRNHFLMYPRAALKDIQKYALGRGYPSRTAAV